MSKVQIQGVREFLSMDFYFAVQLQCALIEEAVQFIFFHGSILIDNKIKDEIKALRVSSF